MTRKRTRSVGALLLALVMCLSITAYAAGEKAAFTDVKETDYFYPAVQWGVENGITYGVSETRFAPQGKVTRAQVVTFLWRMAGSPAPTGKQTFSDVPAGSWYEIPVQWATENGITFGIGSDKFGPDTVCSRAMCLALLYRIVGSPLDEIAAADPVEIDENASLEDLTLEELGVYLIQQMIEMFRGPEVFPDVNKDDYYELAVIWGAMNGILTDDNTGKMEEGVKFRPDDPCIRSEMISFLYQTKLMQDKANEPELIDLGMITVAIPQAYEELVHRFINAVDDEEEGILITISERASREAAEALGEDPDEIGAGELFSIGRVSEAKAKQIAEEDLGNAEVFAKDENGNYYVFYHPTDVRYMRETTEQMTADQDQWTELNEWARNNVREDILKYSEGLTPVTMGKDAE